MDINPRNINNLIGAILANVNNLLLIALFLARIARRERLECWLGILFICSIFPLGYLFLSGFFQKRSFIYFLWLGLMIVFLILELFLDYILKIDFRHTQWMVIAYVTIFFGATGGMIGLASLAGRGWMLITVTTFLIMAALAFIQRAMTGL